MSFSGTVVPVIQRARVLRQPAGRWRTVKVRDGAKGPLAVKVLLATLQTRDEDGCAGARERLVVLRSGGKRPLTWYTLSNARRPERLPDLVRVHGERHRVEEVLEEGKGEVRLGHYEVRSWVGWHHHVTLTLVALWSLQTERRRLGATPAVTVPQVWPIFTELLKEAGPAAARVAEVVSQVLGRNEESRIYHWYAATGQFPPRRPRPGPPPRGQPAKKKVAPLN